MHHFHRSCASIALRAGDTAALRLGALSAAVGVLLALSGCSKPMAPPTERPPEPKATALRDAVKAPIQKADATAAAAEEASRAQAAAIKAATE